VKLRHLAGEARRLDTAAGLPRIEYYLLDRQLRLVVIHGVRTIQRADREICIAESMLREKRLNTNTGLLPRWRLSENCNRRRWPEWAW
jgi:hypothetical protein